MVVVAGSTTRLLPPTTQWSPTLHPAASLGRSWSESHAFPTTAIVSPRRSGSVLSTFLSKLAELAVVVRASCACSAVDTLASHRRCPQSTPPVHTGSSKASTVISPATTRAATSSRVASSLKVPGLEKSSNPQLVHVKAAVLVAVGVDCAPVRGHEARPGKIRLEVLVDRCTVVARMRRVDEVVGAPAAAGREARSFFSDDERRGLTRCLSAHTSPN